ncbi:MAG: hypothetical protein K1X88_02760 [Nannocystaceae bacterium]|nr:hypothetical protein [Nannocystaceae bacterium]
MNVSSVLLWGLPLALVTACTGCAQLFAPPTAASTPTAGAVPGPLGASTPAPAGVRVNGRALAPAELVAMGADPSAVPAGDYWYDARSGLWGLVGDGARGQIVPGLALGAMDPAVSRGNTGVLINGREITGVELAMVQRVAGAVAPGRYFLEADGRAGPEGGVAVVNLFGAAAGRQASYFGHSGAQGSGGGFYDPATGDSYYSFRDASGNSYSTQ